MNSVNFDWTEFHRIGDAMEGWGGPISKEALYRAAVGRYYYAAFNQLKKYAVATYGYEPDGNEGDHSKLTQYLSDYARDSDCQNISNTLRKLRRHRNNCDYEDSIENIDAIFRTSKMYSELILKYLKITV